MPGILPMKVIKVGTSSQSRIAQACDRCRSKKIRCDGVRPCCSQCANVGFECKTSDKLSRRAFPRGYTESLEERVRSLECEVRELKDLLDEKDEKIDMLSRMHSNTSPSRRSSSSVSSGTNTEQKPNMQQNKEDVFRVQQSPFLLERGDSGSYFVGASSGRGFIDAFKGKIQETGKPCSNFTTDVFFKIGHEDASSPRLSPDTGPPISTTPPRLISDQMVNIFFQEWAPLFPVLHRPTFLKLYEDYTANPGIVDERQDVAQLNLVFGIAALSAERNKQDVTPFQRQWQAALDSILSDHTLGTLQCLILAQIYCILKSDYNKLLRYKGIAIGLSHRLGLHQSQKRFSLGALTSETRKKVFWTLYTLDCFSAALLGLPKLLKEADVHAEYPADVDDENVTERGFQPALPGESTKLSSALALFRASQILSKVLEEIYPASASHELSLQTLGMLSDELDSWLSSLAPHLRLQFVHDKPSTNVVSSRSPLLSLAYYYIRTLIYRPAVGSSLGAKSSPAVHILADASKHIIQIIQLLEERRMSFSFCLNKNEILILAGFGLLFQGLDLNRQGKLIKDSQRLVCSVIEALERASAPGAGDFKKVACSMISIDRFAKDSSASTPALQRRSEGPMSAPQDPIKSTRRQLQAIASRFSFGATRSTKQEQNSSRRATIPEVAPGKIAVFARNNSQLSISSARSEPVVAYGDRQRSICPSTPAHSDSAMVQGGHQRTPVQREQRKHMATSLEGPNLDYLPFGNDPVPTYPITQNSNKASVSTTEWERLLGSLDSGQSNIYDGIYGGPSPDMLSNNTSPLDGGHLGWSPEVWGGDTNPEPRQSGLSISEESLTSGEDFSSCDLGRQEYRGILMPHIDGFGLEGLDGNFGL
ncbi:MAG: hypothetical protein M1830_003853 [Pleopsidium flavum]|nr:MAG: hypothetical protein M1830_003853 [Pleopsidium flavum]